MKSADNKKAQNFGRSGLIAVNTKEVINMNTLTLSFNNVNFSPVQHDGQIWLTANELAKALGYAKSDAVAQVYERNKDEFTSSMTTTLKLSVVRKTGKVEMAHRIFSLRGAHLIAMFSKTIVAKEFRKWVLDVLEREVLNMRFESRQTISPEQQALLHEIVDRRSQGNRKICAEMWSRHNRHFKIPRYAELLAIHFAESVHYLETMEIKSRIEQPKQAALPYPAEVVHVAQQINQEYGQGKYKNWFVSVRDDGILSVQPLNNGYYPMNVAEFTKRFDGVLDYLYGSDLLRLGRYLQNN